MPVAAATAAEAVVTDGNGMSADNGSSDNGASDGGASNDGTSNTAGAGGSQDGDT
jgi:hypothetical protein